IETVRLTHFQQRFVACRNGLMVKPSRLAKHQYPGITLPHLWATGKLDGSISNQHAYKQPVISNFLHISILATTLKYYVFKNEFMLGACFVFVQVRRIGFHKYRLAGRVDGDRPQETIPAVLRSLH